LWLMVTQRTREIGLRRAKGATAGDIRRQVVGEVMVLTAIGVVAGLVVTAQLPLLDVFPSVPWPVYAAGVAVAAVAVLGLAGLCAWVPSRLAASVVPAEALRYE
jgi:putative ABC transport system permease protein